MSPVRTPTQSLEIIHYIQNICLFVDTALCVALANARLSFCVTVLAEVIVSNARTHMHTCAAQAKYNTVLVY